MPPTPDNRKIYRKIYYNFNPRIFDKHKLNIGPNGVRRYLNMLFNVVCFNLTESQPKLSIGDPNHVGFDDFGVGDHSVGAQGAEQILTF